MTAAATSRRRSDLALKSLRLRVMIAPVSCCAPITQYGYRLSVDDVIDLRERDLVEATPRLAAVERDGRALIHAEEDALAVGRIDPHHVVVLAARRALERR